MKSLQCLPLLLIISFHTSLFTQSLNFVSQIKAGTFDYINQVETDAENSILFAGYFNESIDINPTSGTNLLDPTGQRDIFIGKLDAQGNYLWGFSLGSYSSSISLNIDDLVIDDENNFYITGNFTNQTDFDPGTDIHTLNADNGNRFIAKYDGDANLIWVFQVGGSGNNSSAIVTDLTLDNNGFLYLAGSHKSFVSIIDTAGNSYGINGTGINNFDFFVAKINAETGTVVWRYFTGGTEQEQAFGLAVDSGGNVYTTGLFNGEVDFDWGAFPQSVYTAQSTGDAFILKLNSDGGFVWAGVFTSENTCHGDDIMVDSEDNVIVSGGYGGTIDLDMGPGVSTFNSNGTYTTKFDGDGNFIWKAVFSESLYITSRHLMDIDSDGNIYHTGSFDDNFFWSGNFLAAAGNKDVFVSKMTADGEFSGLQRIGGIGGEIASDIALDNNGNIAVVGRFQNTIDFDFGGNTLYANSLGSSDFFITSLNGICLNFTGKINETNQVICNDAGRAVAHAFGGEYPYQYLWNTSPLTTDSIAFFPEIGNYELTVSDNLGCERVVGFSIGGTGENAFDDYHFTGNLVGGDFRTGFSTIVKLDVFNQNCVPADANIKLLPHYFLSYENAEPAPDFIVNDTLIWEASSLSFSSTHFMPKVWFKVSENAEIGDNISLKLIITPTENDVNEDDNFKTYYFPIINSFDPNDKQVFPARCSENFISQDEVLTYTVRFQNTGNAAAINIHILDTLDANLDISTLRVIGNSHPVITEIWEENIINFRFDNILLIDSLTNEEESQGYVIFEIDPIPNLQIGTEIQNRAAIYFDFNPPIITNTISNTIIDELPNCMPVSTSNLVRTEKNIQLFPNPANETIQLFFENNFEEYPIYIFDEIGKLVVEKNISKETNTIEIGHLSNGFYSIQIELDNQIITKKFVKIK